MDEITLIRQLDRLQEEMHRWRLHNFPDADADQQLMGVYEEAGELTHAHLKHIQGIRGMDDDTAEFKKTDAIGDLIIYLMGYCSYSGISLSDAITLAWEDVKDRDWIKYPETGYPPKDDDAGYSEDKAKIEARGFEWS